MIAGRFVSLGAVLGALAVTPAAHGASAPFKIQGNPKSSTAATKTIDRNGANVDALRGVVVWQHHAGGSSVLMRRINGHSGRVPGVRASRSFRSINLGLDTRGRVVVAYLRCDLRGACSGPFVSDVRSGERRQLSLPTPAGCSTAKAVSVWRERVAYVARCQGGSKSGVYVARNGRTRLLLGLTTRQTVFAPHIDLTSGLVAAAADDIGVRVASTAGSACSAVLDSGTGSDFGPVQATPGGVSWVRETLGSTGGGVATAMSVQITGGCTATPSGPPTKLSHSNIDSFAVSGATRYIAAEGSGVVAEPAS